MKYPQFLAPYKPVLLFAICSLLLLSASRGLLVIWQWARVDSVDGLATVMLQGVRFDIILVCAVLVLPALLSPILCHSSRWLVVLKVYLTAMFLLIVFMESATPPFIYEYDQRPNILFVEYLKYPAEVSKMLWQGYKLEIFSSTIILGLFGFWFKHLLSARVVVTPRSGLVSVLFTSSVVLLVCLVGIRSSTGHRPANPSVVAFSSDLLVNDLTLSSTYNVLYAIYSSKRHESSVRAYGRMALADAVAQVRQDMAIVEQDFISSELPTLHRSSWVKERANPPNLVIILQESLGAEFVGALGGLKVTPELDKLAQEGIWFEHLYATGTRSVRGIEAVVTGFTPTPARSVVKLPKSQTGFFTVAELLQRRGYDTSFIYGGEAHFDNMRQFFVGNGFQTIIERKDIVDPVFVGSWGASDEDLFRTAHEKFSMAGDKPFFSLVFTSSNHSPFEFPAGRIELYDEDPATVNNAVKYADHAMGEFFRQAKKSPYWDNTLFLVVADHNSRVRGANLVPIEYFHVPALILGGEVAARNVSRLASQIDLLPTLLGMMGIADVHPATGHDLFRPDIDQIPGRAIMQYNSAQAYMQGSAVVVMEQGKTPTLYNYTPETGLQVAPAGDGQLVKRALAYSVWSATAYQKGLYRLPESD
jgi:phosphoglycerol transferase MdoB-like AlkP superfamily enzyme